MCVRSYHLLPVFCAASVDYILLCRGVPECERSIMDAGAARGAELKGLLYCIS